MTTSETLAAHFDLTYRVIHRQIDGLTHEDSLIQPPFRGNCLNWVLGHIIANRDSVLTWLGEALPWDEAEMSRYQRNSEPVTGAEHALPLEQLLGYLEDSQARVLAGLQHVPAEKLGALLDDVTLGEKIAFKHWHETYHVGQLELLRQLAGKNDKVI